MLAVKHISLSGHEEIYLTKRVSYQPELDAARVGPNEPGRIPPCVFIDRDDGSTYQLSGGTIFVMNDAGKTVSRYDIGASMVPMEGKGPEGVRIV